jgi:Flp pilus assembly protein CpaB
MSPIRSRLAGISSGVRRSILVRRRLLAAVLSAVAVLAGLRAVAPPAPAQQPVLTAAADLAAGTVLTADDLAEVGFAPGTTPAGASALDDAVGRTLAAPLREGEPLTDVRLVGPGLLAGEPQTADVVAVPVRIPDASAVGLVHVGDRINLLSTDPRGGGTEIVAARLPVLALPQNGGAAPTDTRGGATGGAANSGRLVVLATTTEMSRHVADAAVLGYLSITLTR